VILFSRMRSSSRAKAQQLENRLVRLGAAVCRIAGDLPAASPGGPISRQLVRACTSPAANYAEARECESSKDFIHKLKLCLKELRETRVWLELAAELRLMPQARARTAIAEVDELISIFVVSVSTSRRKSSPQP